MLVSRGKDTLVLENILYPICDRDNLEGVIPSCFRLEHRRD